MGRSSGLINAGFQANEVTQRTRSALQHCPGELRPVVEGVRGRCSLCKKVRAPSMQSGVERRVIDHERIDEMGAGDAQITRTADVQAEVPSAFSPVGPSIACAPDDLKYHGAPRRRIFVMRPAGSQAGEQGWARRWRTDSRGDAHLARRSRRDGARGEGFKRRAWFSAPPNRKSWTMGALPGRIEVILEVESSFRREQMWREAGRRSSGARSPYLRARAGRAANASRPE